MTMYNCQQRCDNVTPGLPSVQFGTSSATSEAARHDLLVHPWTIISHTLHTAS